MGFGDPRWERRMAEWLARHGWRVQRTIDGKPNPAHLWQEDAEFWTAYQGISRLTLVAAPAAFVLWNAARATTSLPGALVEVGVYQGGTLRLLADAVAGSGEPPIGFDTFAGMPATDPDRDIHLAGDFADTSVPAVRAAMAGREVSLRQGIFPTGVDTAGLDEVRFAHIDVDIYASVLGSTEYLYPRLVPGGVIVYDDYGWTSCPGARQGVDEFFANVPEQPVYLPTGQALVWKLPCGD